MPMYLRGLTIPEIFDNEEGVYAGNLRPYMPAILLASNGLNPYHNVRHMLHVFFLCYKACRYYRGTLTAQEQRELLLAALFHDYDHRGITKDDHLNIQRALRGLYNELVPEDIPAFGNITELIRSTEFPHPEPENKSLSMQILCDADMGQVFSTAWIQQVPVGLACEMGVSVVQMLEMQEPFLRELRFQTEWGQEEFPTEVITAKIAEAKHIRSFFPE